MSRVYIGRLSYRAREKDVERFFKGYGKILEVDLKNGYAEAFVNRPILLMKPAAARAAHGLLEC